MTKDRKPWIDWMKVIRMFFIVWGHCGPDHSASFIWAFSVPLFFCLSGYLSEKWGCGNYGIEATFSRSCSEV